MNTSTAPFSLPRKLEPDLARVRAYWEGLKRGDADMPFSDDVNLSALPDLSGRLMLIEVFDQPMRFRLGMLGQEIKARYRGDVVGKFLDEIDIRPALQYLHAQCSAVVESRAPTYYRHGSTRRSRASTADAYSRLLLPTWGEGRIGMLLAGVAWG